jgi:hypothetical protein
MNGNAEGAPINWLTGLRRRSKAGSARPMPPPKSAELDWVLAEARDDGLSRDRLEWAHTPARIPWLEGADYRYRLGSHQLILATCGVARRHEAAVGRAEAEFALVVEGPLLVFGSRFGDSRPWSWAAPYNWHFAPPAERVVPAALPLTPEGRARLWATLRITLLDRATGRARIGRAVALRPEFTHALHGELRGQAMRPFRVEAAVRAWERLRLAAGLLELQARVVTKCAAVSDHGGRGASTRAGRDDSAQSTSMRKLHDSRPRHLDHHRRWVLDAHPPYLRLPPPLPGGPGGRPVARGCGEPPDESIDSRARLRPRPRP